MRISLKNVLVMSLVLALGMCAPAYAQEQPFVQGTVTDAAAGTPLPGVNVVVRGTNIGTATGADGTYRLDIPAEADSLVFSYIGYEAQTVAIDGRSVIDVQLMSATIGLEDVVVTAFGVEREQRALGYAVEEVEGEEIVETRQTNLVNALQGKIAGARVTSTGGAPGQSARIILRGITSLGPDANNQPLFVVDGIPISNATITGGEGNSFVIGNGVIDLNAQDIQSVTVLKGPSAAALYGIRAANGAIIIETKNGQPGRTRVSFTSTSGMERVVTFPEQQTEYLAGWYGDPTYKTYDFAFHAWGPKADTVAGAQFYDNFRNFFRYDGPGLQFKNALSISGGGETSTFYLSASHLRHKGVVPNQLRTSISMRATGQINLSDRLRVNASANYVVTDARKVHLRGMMYELVYWPTSIDVTADYIKDDGTQDVYTPWLTHPLYEAYNRTMDYNHNRLIGYVGFDYDVADWLNLHYKLGTDFTNDFQKDIVPGPLGVPGENPLDDLGFIDLDEIRNRQITSTFRVTFQDQLTDRLHGTLHLGNDIFERYYHRTSTEGEDFGTPPDFYTLENTAIITSFESGLRKRLIGVYGELSLNYDDYLYLTLTGRNDWSSTLPKDSRSFFYPSASLSFVFSEVMDLPDVFDYGKLRASVAQVGKDAPPYVLGITYEPYTFNEQTALAHTNVIGDPNLKPERTTSIEFGTNLRFFDDRLGLDATIYQSNSRDQIIPVPVSDATGITRLITNAGEIRNRGIEVVLRGTPIQTEDFSWDVSANFSKNENQVISIREGIEAITLSGTSTVYGVFDVYMQLLPGRPYGIIFGPVYERYYENPDNEDPLFLDRDRPILIGEDGFPMLNFDRAKVIGNMLPDWTAGITNTLRYKNVEWSFLLDIRRGGDLYNTPTAFFAAQGTLPITANRDEFKVFEGVTADGTPNTKKVWLGQGIGPDGVDYGDGFYRNVYRRSAANFIEDASWIRLQTVSLTYHLPTGLLRSTPVRDASLTFTGNNFLLWTPYSGFDPMMRQYGGYSNTQGFQGLGTPPTRSLSFTLHLTF